MKPRLNRLLCNVSIATLTLLICCSCGEDKTPPAPDNAEAATAATTTAPATEAPALATENPAAPAPAFDPSALIMEPGQALTDGSVYDLASTWQNANGETIQLGDLGGKVRVIAMGYSSCQYACPRLIADMRRLREQIISGTPDGVGFVFVSIDPENDTPEKLKAYAERNQFDDSDDWLMLTGDEDSVLELAVILGMKYRKADDMDFAHSNIISVLDASGAIVHQQFGLGTDNAETIAAILAAAAANPTD